MGILFQHPQHALNPNPKGPRALKPYYLGPWTLRGKAHGQIKAEKPFEHGGEGQRPRAVRIFDLAKNTVSGIFRDPSTQIIPTLGPKVCKYYLHWASWILIGYGNSLIVLHTQGSLRVLTELCDSLKALRTQFLKLNPKAPLTIGGSGD